MRIGILQTDEFSKENLTRYGDYAEMFQKLFLSIDSTLSFSTYQVTQLEYPSVLDECDAYIVTGSQFGAYDDEAWIKKLIQFVIELHNKQKKLAGICFGHQLIAHALGGRVQKSEKGWGVGIMSSDIKSPVNESDWLEPKRKSFSLLMSHQDQVVELPPGAVLVAGNAFCSYAAFQMGNSVLTFQGHPEFSLEYMEHVLEKQCESIGEEVCKAARSSLSQPCDQKLVARWLLNFVS